MASVYGNLCQIRSWLSRSADREGGASLIEYALLVALIAMVCILGVTFLGSSTSTRFSSVGNALT